MPTYFLKLGLKKTIEFTWDLLLSNEYVTTINKNSSCFTYHRTVN